MKVIVLIAILASVITAASFTNPPQVTSNNGQLSVSFTVSASTDVEVAVIDASGNIIRHLAAGVLGGQYPPPAPLSPGFSQNISWDGKDDYGNPAGSGPFDIRVRLGVVPKFVFSISTKNIPGTTYPSPFMARGEVLEASHVSVRVFVPAS